MDDLITYDKAKYHMEDVLSEGLDLHQAYVHIGMFLGWLCDNHLLSEEMLEDFSSEIQQFYARKITGPELLEISDGPLLSDMLSDQGNAFTKYYWIRYLNDYVDLLTDDLKTIYHVADTWENYDRIRERIDARYREWNERP